MCILSAATAFCVHRWVGGSEGTRGVMCKALSTAPRVWREWEAERKESQPLSDPLRPPNTAVGGGGVGEQTEAGLG